ncbi:MAG: hypothetical protein LBD96_07870 [Treponema sp.]|jgi:hypothetical protein|nr:hypothetical protein [Treponema sp.]
MIRSLRPCHSFLSSIVFITTLGAGFGQEPSLEDLLPGLRERAVVLEITSRVVDWNQQIVWNSVKSKVMFPGRPVRINMVGTNVAMTLQFTLFFRLGNPGSVLVAQGQIWVEVPDKGIWYQPTLQTIPIEVGESIFFFPLGSPNSPEETWIELQLAIWPYEEYDRMSEPQRGRWDPTGTMPFPEAADQEAGETEAR